MEHLQWINDALQKSPMLGLWITFLIAFAEALPIVGTLIPGSVTMTAVGTLIGTGTLPGALTLLVATLGALIGDIIGYWFGYYFRDQIPHYWPFNRNPHWLERSEQFISHHGGKSVIIGRFIGPARSAVPMVAGLMGMRPTAFLLAAIPSALLWSLAYTTPGILIGALSVELPPELATEFILFGIIWVVALWFVFWVIQYFFVQLALTCNHCVDRLWHWFSRHHSSRFIIRWLTNQTHPEDHHQLNFALSGLLLLLCFIILALWVHFVGPHNNLNIAMFNLMQNTRTPTLDIIFLGFTCIANTKIMFLVGLMLTGGLCRLRQWRAAKHLFLLLVSTAITVTVVKFLVHSPRPTGFMHPIESFSFPSGHTALTLVVSFFSAFLCAKLVNPGRRWIPYSLATVLTLMVGISRFYLGAHWLTDVIGSLLLCFGLLLFAVVSYRRHPLPYVAFAPKKRTWFFLLAACFTIPTFSYTAVKYHSEQQKFVLQWPIYHIGIGAWWQQPQRYLSVYRKNRFGKAIQPLNVQWAAPLSHIERNLQQRGWQTLSTKPTIASMIKRFTSEKPQYHMPLWPWLYHTKPPVLVMIKSTANSSAILELRLWRTEVIFVDSRLPLWIGALNRHDYVKSTQPGEKTYRIDFASQESLSTLAHDASQFTQKSIHIPNELQPGKIQALKWPGQVLLLKQHN